jgi:hypothetical protein
MNAETDTGRLPRRFIFAMTSYQRPNADFTLAVIRAVVQVWDVKPTRYHERRERK